MAGRKHNLYILRHADAEKQNYDEDFNRQLTACGISQMERLRQRGLSFSVDFSLVSAAARTKKTYELLKLPSPCHFVEELYETNFKVFSQIVARYAPLYKEASSFLFVGHNPFVSELATKLSGEEIQLGTADLVMLDIEGFASFSEALEATGAWNIKPL